MSTLQVIISMLIGISATLCIIGKYMNNQILVYIFKPLTTLLIIILACLGGIKNNINYQYLVYLGLIFSLFGDIFLMLPKKFIQGLISFLIAHIFFLFFFINQAISVNWWLIGVFVIIGTSIYLFLLPHLNKMKIPVLIYLIVIFSMAWRGWEVLLTNQNKSGAIFALASILFIFSDTNIAFNKFRKSYISAEFFILSTYYISIWLIALSLNYI